MSGATRLLEPARIPRSLWDASSDLLFLPASLSSAYVEAVDANGLRSLGTSRKSGDGPVGGFSKESTDEHFAQAFDGSAARALLALLDPKHDAGSTSDHFIQVTAGNRLTLTDAPCGAGAASLAFLTGLAQLRAEHVLPRLPLDVRVIGAEISAHARWHAIEMFERVRTALESQAIFVTCNFVEWDVTDEVSTADLIKTLLRGDQDSARLLVVANFNGFLEKERKRKEAQPQLDELFRYSSGRASFAVWIEPNMNRATAKGGFFPWLFDLFNKGRWKRFSRLHSASSVESPVFQSESRFRLPLSPTESARVTLAAMPIELDR